MTEAERSIEVSDLPEGIEEKKLTIYFQKKKSNGGEVEKVTISPESNAAIVLFKNPEVPSEVIKKEHVILGKRVKVNLVKTEVKKAPPSQSNNTKTILVSNLPEGMSKNAIKIYFQKKKLGNHTVKSITLLDGGKDALVTFENPEAARLIASKQHKMQNQEIKIELQEDQDQDSETETGRPNNLNGNKDFSEDNKQSKTPNQSTYKFPPPRQSPYQEKEKVEKAESKETLDEPDKKGQGFTEVQRTILVCDIPPDVVEQDLIMYFQKKINGGGELAHAKLFPGERKALLVFEEVEVADGVVTKKHTLKGREVTVEKYKPAPEKIEIDYVFPKVTALVNYALFQNLEPSTWKAILDETNQTTGAQWHDASHGFLLTGTLDQIVQAEHFLLKKLDVVCVGQQGSPVHPGVTMEQPRQGFVQPRGIMGQRPRFMGQQRGIMGQPQRFMVHPQRFMGQPQQIMEQRLRFMRPQILVQQHGLMGQPPGIMVQPQIYMPGQPPGYTAQGQHGVMRHPQVAMGLPQGTIKEVPKHGRQPQEIPGHIQYTQYTMEPQTQGHFDSHKASTVPKSEQFGSEENESSEQIQHGYNGQGVHKKPTLCTPSSFTEKSQKDGSGVKDRNFSEQGKENTSFSHERPNLTSPTDASNTQVPRPTPAPRRAKPGDPKSTHDESGGCREERRKMGANFSPLPSTNGEDQSDGHRDSRRVSSPTGKNNLMAFGMGAQCGEIKSQLGNREENGQRGSAKSFEENGSGVTLDQAAAEAAAAAEVKLFESRNGADGGTTQPETMTNVLASFDQMSLRDSQSPMGVAQFVLEVHKSDIEQFKSQYQVDVILSMDKQRLEFKGMHGFNRSDTNEVVRRLQQLHEQASKNFTTEKLDLSEMSGANVEKVKMAISKKLEHTSDVMVMESSQPDVFYVVGDADNVGLFQRNMLSIMQSGGGGHDQLESTGPLVANRKGVRVVLMMGDIEKQDSQAIVNFADNVLGNTKGLAYSIREAAGEEFWKECRSIISRNGELVGNMVVVTTAGDLPSQSVIHAILDSSDEKRQDVLRFNLEAACRQVLNKAKENHVKSISFPLITPEIGNLPCVVASRVLFDVLKKFFESNSSLTSNGDSIEEIRIVYRKHGKHVEDSKTEFLAQF